jgi:hypothetical protein
MMISCLWCCAGSTCCGLRARERILGLLIDICMQPGDALPDVTLFEGTPGNKIKLRDLFAGKKVSAV